MKNIIFFIGLICFTVQSGYSQSWIKQESNTNSNLNSVYFLNETTGFVAGDNGLILKTVNGGEKWDSIPSGTSNNLYSVCFIDSLTGFANSWHELLKTTDGGESWFIQDTVSNSFLYKIQFIDRDTGFVGCGGIMLKTVNGGVSWIKQKSFGGSSFCFWAIDSKTFYVGADEFWVFKSIDGGETWFESHKQGFPVNMEGLFFTNRNTGFAVGGGFAQGFVKGAILKTTNGGIDWTSDNYDNNSWFRSVFFANEKAGYVVGGSGSILKTTDGGKIWINLNSRVTSTLNSIFFSDSLTGYVVGTSGTILKTSSGGTNAIASYKKETRVNLFPNPVTDYITLKNEQNIGNEITIYNINGIISYHKKILDPITHLDLTVLKKGIYIVKIIGKEDVTSYRIVKQ